MTTKNILKIVERWKPGDVVLGPYDHILRTVDIHSSQNLADPKTL